MPSIEKVLLNLLIIVGVAIAARALSNRFRRVPYAAALVAAGLAVSALQYDFAINLSHDLILYIILPPILFAGSFRLDVPRFRRNLPLITLLLLIALPVSVVLMGVAMGFAFDFQWIAALLLGSMLYPLDPAAVLSVFEEMEPPDRLLAIIEGEPLFDDGLAAVIYSTLISIMQGSQGGQGRADQICIVHDLGEALNGDIPVPDQTGDEEPEAEGKSEIERRDFLALIESLPAHQKEELTALWDYERLHPGGAACQRARQARNVAATRAGR